MLRAWLWTASSTLPSWFLLSVRVLSASGSASRERPARRAGTRRRPTISGPARRNPHTQAHLRGGDLLVRECGSRWSSCGRPCLAPCVLSRVSATADKPSDARRGTELDKSVTVVGVDPFVDDENAPTERLPAHVGCQGIDHGFDGFRRNRRGARSCALSIPLAPAIVAGLGPTVRSPEVATRRARTMDTFGVSLPSPRRCRPDRGPTPKPTRAESTNQTGASSATARLCCRKVPADLSIAGLIGLVLAKRDALVSARESANPDSARSQPEGSRGAPAHHPSAE